MHAWPFFKDCHLLTPGCVNEKLNGINRNQLIPKYNFGEIIDTNRWRSRIYEFRDRQKRKIYCYRVQAILKNKNSNIF